MAVSENVLRTQSFISLMIQWHLTCAQITNFKINQPILSPYKTKVALSLTFFEENNHVNIFWGINKLNKYWFSTVANGIQHINYN